ncbi:MAG: hypothetical protein IKR46_00440 [Clostridia bacterium]|nr:hypothetical protein [Clostridia bacterium]
MEFYKTAQNFNMRFFKDCRAVCFSSMSLPILRGENCGIFAPLSVGGYAAVLPRKDGRFTAEFDDNQKYITANISEIGYHREEPMLSFLKRAEDMGAMLSGAEILFRYNTKIYQEYEPLLLTSTYLFCQKTLPPYELKNCLSAPLKDYASLVGKRGNLLFIEGDKSGYIKFSDSLVKIVLCPVKQKNAPQSIAEISVINAVSSLAMGDYEQFSKIVTAEYEKMPSGRHTKALFEIAKRLGDGLGFGILEKGGIFAVVENGKVNTFIHNLKMEYENYCGKAPDFYVASTENSGINAVKKDL